MIKKFKNEEIFEILRGLLLVKGIKNEKFRYAVAKNTVKFRSAVEEIQKILQDVIYGSKEYKKYEKDRLMINERYADKDDKKKPILEQKMNSNGQMSEVFKMDSDAKMKSSEEVRELTKGKYKKIFDKEESLLKETSEVDVHIIEHVPVEVDAEQLGRILPIVLEKEEE